MARAQTVIDVQAGEDSPFSFAVSQNDRQTIAMVRQALRLGRVKLAYQPAVLGNDPTRVAFYEGLIRVLDDKGRVIPARDFMDAVETTEVGREIDCAALAAGLQTLAEQPNIRLSINMSARSVGYPKWSQILRDGLAAYPSVGERLILEITESSAMTVPEIVMTFMDDLQCEGIAFAMDDFGAGFTSLRYLRDFNFDILKIDAQFIRNIGQDRDNQVVVSALLSIARQFDMLCTAEAVETQDEAAFLQALGVDCLQGYLFGAPSITPRWN